MPDWLVGIELEIENFDPEVDRDFGGMEFTSDGSLRETQDGVGIEAITSPISIKYVPAYLEGFFSKYKITEYNYSERCSTHVHVNVEPLEWDQLASLCLVYQTVERLLFRFIGNNRESSIFCVPWNQTSLSYDIVYEIAQYGSTALRRWQKYSAMNLLPVTSQGTVEFRHLEGTCSISRIMDWISLLVKMVEYSINNPLPKIKTEIMGMNTVSNYREWLMVVFGKYSTLLETDGYNYELAQGVIDSKLMIHSEFNKKRKFIPHPDHVEMNTTQYEEIVGRVRNMTIAAQAEEQWEEQR
jgi:hypothetical protein